MTRAKLVPLVALFVALGGCDTTFSADSQSDDMAHAGPTMNFHRIDSKLATGGHFTGDGIAEIAEQGVSLVIDLRDDPPNDVGQSLEAAGIRYVNVPVVWRSPKAEDFAEFARQMPENEGEHILVQCQANYRASAMTYMYRVREGGVPEPEARKDLNAIWTPEGTWAEYVNEILDSKSAD